jgi:hypothetical protein
MRMKSGMVKTVAFVCIKCVDGTMVPKGTAFFVGERKSFKFCMYVVTAKHILDEIRLKTALDEVYVTYNGPSGKEETKISLSQWVFHPGHSLEKVDVAVARFKSKAPFTNPEHVLCWMMENLITISAVKRIGIGVGYEVGLAGLFVHHQGLNRNIPIVRSGNIAAMPEEPVSTRIGPITALLVEIRSVGGLSGSPVFTETAEGVWLIGLVHGHFGQRASDLDISVEDSNPSFQEESINAGIAIVVPADRIRETLKPLIDVDFS